MAILEEDEPLWRRVLFNELFLAFIAALVILFLAFRFATGRPSEDEDQKPKKPAPAGRR